MIEQAQEMLEALLQVILGISTFLAPLSCERVEALYSCKLISVSRHLSMIN